jgi:hypothetical protein
LAASLAVTGPRGEQNVAPLITPKLLPVPVSVLASLVRPPQATAAKSASGATSPADRPRSDPETSLEGSMPGTGQVLHRQGVNACARTGGKGLATSPFEYQPDLPLDFLL